MRKAFDKTIIITEFRNQFISMEKFRSTFQKLDELFLSLSHCFKKSSYTKLLKKWMNDYISDLNQLHDEKISKLISSFKKNLNCQKREKEKIDEISEEIQNLVEEEYFEIEENLMCFVIGVEEKKKCLKVVENYFDLIFRFENLFGLECGFKENKRKKKKDKKIAKVKKVLENKEKKLSQDTLRKKGVIFPEIEVENIKIDRLKHSYISFAGFKNNSILITKSHTKSLLEYYYQGSRKGKIEEITLTTNSLYNLYMRESQILLSVEEKDPSTQIFSSIQFIEEENPNRRNRLTLNMQNREGENFSNGKDSYRVLRLMRNGVLIKNFHRCYFREYHYSRIAKKNNTLIYTNGPKDITVIPNLQFCTLSDQKNVSFFNVDVVKCISAVCILDEERIAILGESGKILVYNFEGNIEASFDGNPGNDELTGLEGFSIDASIDNSFLVANLNFPKKNLNVVQVLSLNKTVFSKSSLTLVDEWQGVEKSGFKDVKFGPEIRFDKFQKEFRAVHLDQLIVAASKKDPHVFNFLYLNSKGKIEVFCNLGGKYGFADQIFFQEDDDGVFVTGGYNDFICLVRLHGEEVL